MKELFLKFYHFFDWGNGENTCIQFSVIAVAIGVAIGVEIYNRVKGRSLFF